MNRTALISVLIFLLPGSVFSYRLDWINPIGTELKDYGLATAYDSVNNRVYVAGVFDTIVRQGDTVGMPFLEAFEVSGTSAWRVKTTGLNGSDIILNGNWLGAPQRIMTDNAGYVYMCGWCCNTILIDTISLPQRNGQSCHGNFSGDLYVAKYTPAGRVSWAKRFECQGQYGFNDMAVLSDGVYVCGTCSGDIGLDSITLGTVWPTFICKLSPSGELGWFKYFVGPGQVFLNPLPDTMQLMASFYGGATFGGQSLLNNGETGIVFAKITRNGDIAIGRIYHGADIYFSSKAVDLMGNMYVAGTYTKPSAWGRFTLQPQSEWNFVLAKVNPVDSIMWLEPPSLCMWGVPGMSVGRISILWNSSDRLFFTGSFSGTLAFDSDTLRVDTVATPTRSSRFDGFMFSFDNTGHSDWGRQFAGPKIDVINGVCQKGRSELFLTGEFDSIATFMQGRVIAKGKSDAFLCRLSIDTNASVRNPFDRQTGSTARKSRYLVGIINRKDLANPYEYYDFLGKRIPMTSNRNDLLGKLAVIHVK